MKHLKYIIAFLVVASVAHAATPIFFRQEIRFPNLTADRAVFLNASGAVSASTVNSTELSQLATMDSTTVASGQWSYLGALDQSLATTDSPTFNGVTTNAPAVFSHETTPSNPSSGFVKLYPKSDNKLYLLDSAGAETEIGSGGGGGAGAYVNLAVEQDLNWDVELGDTTSFTNNGSGTLSASTTVVFQGTHSMSYDASTSGDYVDFGPIDVSSLDNNNCVASFWYQGFDDNIEVQVVNASGNLVNSASQTLSASTTWVRQESGMSFICDDDAVDENHYLRLYATGDAAIGYVDNIWVGENYLVGNVGPENIFSAKVTSAGVVSDENTDWIDGDCSLDGSNTVTCNVSPLNNTATMNCLGTYVTTNNANRGFFKVRSDGEDADTIAFAVNGDGATSQVANDVRIMCQKAGSDYRPVAFKADQLAQVWSGKHEDDCSFVTSGTGSFNQPTGDSTCTFTEKTNTNFGTVTSGADGTGNQPTIIFTPKRTGDYFVCASFTSSYSSNTIKNFRLYDDTNSYEITNQSKRGQTNTANLSNNFQLCGVFNVPSVAETTIELQTYNDSSTNTIAGNSVSSTPAVEWSVFKLTEGQPHPLIKGAVVTSYGGVLARETARINNAAGTPSVGIEFGNWIDDSSFVDNGTGDTFVAFEPGTFSANPICLVTGYISTPHRFCYIHNVTPTTTDGVRVRCANDAGISVDQDFNLECTGPR